MEGKGKMVKEGMGKGKTVREGKGIREKGERVLERKGERIM